MTSMIIPPPPALCVGMVTDRPQGITGLYPMDRPFMLDEVFPRQRKPSSLSSMPLEDVRSMLIVAHILYLKAIQVENDPLEFVVREDFSIRSTGDVCRARNLTNFPYLMTYHFFKSIHTGTSD